MATKAAARLAVALWTVVLAFVYAWIWWIRVTA